MLQRTHRWVLLITSKAIKPTKKRQEYDEQAAKNAKSGGRNPQP
jgi:hypothetical protein